MKKNPINLQSKLVQFLTLAVFTILWLLSEESTNVDYAAFPVMLALGIAQMGMSAYDKFQADAERDALNLKLDRAAEDMENIKYTNALKGYSVPKNQVALDNLGQQTTQIVDAAQEGGQRGVLGTVGKVRQLFDKGTMAVSQADQMRQAEADLAIKENQQNVDNMNTNLQAQIGMQNIYGLQGALGYQQARGNNAMSNFYSGLGTTIAGVGDLTGGAPKSTTGTDTPTELPDINYATGDGGKTLNQMQANALGNTNTQNVGYGMMGRGVGGMDPMTNYNNYLMDNNLTQDQFTFDEFISQGGLNINNPFGTLGM